MRKLLFLFILSALPSVAAFSRVSHCSGTGSASSCTLNSTGADMIVITVSSDSGVTGIAESGQSGGSNTFNTAVANTATPSQLTVFYAYSATLHTGASHQFIVTVGGGVGFCNFYIATYSGALTASGPLDGTPTVNTTSGVTIQPGSYTPTCTDELMISGLAAFGVSVPTISGGTWAITDARANNSGYAGGMADDIQTTATTDSGPTWTMTTSYAASVVGFKAASSTCGGGSTPVKHRVITGGLE